MAQQQQEQEKKEKQEPEWVVEMNRKKENPFGENDIDWSSNRNQEVEKELREYIDFIRRNPRAGTPGRTRKYDYQGRGQEAAALPDLGFSQVAGMHAAGRLRMDWERSVSANMRAFRVRSRQRSRRRSRGGSRGSLFGLGEVEPLPAIVPQDSDDDLEDHPKLVPVIGPSCDALDPASIGDVETGTVRDQLAGRRVMEAIDAKPNERSTTALLLGRRDGEYEDYVRNEYLEKKIEIIKRERAGCIRAVGKNTKKRRRNNKNHHHHQQQQPSQRTDKEALRLQAEARLERQRREKRIAELEEEARFRALLDLERLNLMHEARQQYREFKMPTVQDITDRPRRWVERKLVDSVLSGAPGKTRRQLALLCLFPSSAPKTLGMALQFAARRVRASSQHTALSTTDWVAERIGELDTGTKGEPLVVAAVRVLLEARRKEKDRRRLPDLSSPIVDAAACLKSSTGCSHPEKKQTANSSPCAYIECLRMLSEFGVDVNAADASGWAPVHYAASAGDAGALAALIDRCRVNPNLRASNGKVALHLGLECLRDRDAVAVCCDLVGRRVDLRVADVRGQTGLHVAAKRGLRDVVELLLVAGLDPHTTDVDGHTPADMAKIAGHTVVADVIRTYRSPIASDLGILSAEKRLDILRLQAEAEDQGTVLDIAALAARVAGFGRDARDALNATVHATVHAVRKKVHKQYPVRSRRRSSVVKYAPDSPS